MFVDPQPSDYDLNFRLLGTDVRVHPSFWIFSAILGWGYTNQPNGFTHLFMWVMCVFVSILIHEMGHVLVGRLFGSDGHIVLYGFGGLAIGSSTQRSRWQRILVYAAGPAAQFLLLAILIAFIWIQATRNAPALIEDDRPRFQDVLGLENSLMAACLFYLGIINFFWPLFNLLPIYPLDGGQISREVFQAISPRNGTKASLSISICVAAVMAVVAFRYTGSLFNTFLFGMLAYESYQLLQFENNFRQPWREDYPDR